MKNYKHILEAVNKGLQLALDDFDDDETTVVHKRSKQVSIDEYELVQKAYVNNLIFEMPSSMRIHLYHLIMQVAFGYIFHIDDLDMKDINGNQLEYSQKKILVDYINKHNITEREYIDLDLPSGTKWRIENIGASKKNLLGSYFRWGCTEEYESRQPSYDDKYHRISSEKYTSDLDNSHKIESVLDLEDDAAHNIDSHIRIPSKQQYEELIKYTDMVQVYGKLVFISKKNPLNFIWFEPKNDLYLTSSYSNEVITGPTISNRVLSDKIISIYMIKFFKNDDPEPKFMPFINIGGQLPPVRGHIRPVWYK